MAMAVESWDDDVDFAPEAPLFTQSVSTVQTSLSSRLSVRSESNVGDDDWNVVLTPNDDQSTTNAILKATQAGIPIPQNVPSSALLGGTIKRLGKKKSRQKIDDDWDNDLEMPDSGLSLKPKAPEPAPTAPGEQEDEFDEWAEGSLGIRFAGTRRNRSTSASAMSPSLGSVTMDSEAEDELKGLELPDNMDFEAMLKKRRAADAELSDLSQASPAIEQPSTINTHKKSKLLSDDNDDFFSDLDFGPSANDLLDTKKRTMNKNLKVKTSRPSQPPAAQRPATTLNFHDKPTDKPTHVRSHIPRPVSGTVKAGSRLAPVLETGATESLRPDRRQTTTTGAQLLRSKRSMPVLGRQQPQPAPKPSAPFLPAGGSNFQSSRAVASQQRAVPLHLRRDSDPNSRPHSPPSRSYSRLSTAFVPETPSRTSRRPELATAALAREAASKRTVTKPARRRNFGDGSELEIFDDLPTSQSKESKFVKAPVARGPPKAMGLRHVASKSDVREPIKRNLAIPDRMTTPAPPPMTPRSPFKGFHEQQQQQANSTPSYLRDTAASRIARETRLGGTGLGPNGQRPRSEGPLMPVSTNWKAQIAARSPHTSPSAQRNKGKRVQPQLIKAIGAHLAKTEKGMTYNPHTLRWEGNENTLQHFDLPPVETPTPTGHREPQSYMDARHPPPQARPPPPSPPRPALIAPMSTASTQNIQVVGGMVFDPRAMKWLKFKSGEREASGPLSPSVTDNDEEEDVFAGLDDLKDENSPAVGAGGSVASPNLAPADGGTSLHEEFDLGPAFITRQRDEEALWRKKCEGWFPHGESRVEDERSRWTIREIARELPAY